ncbi:MULTISPECIES: hypothetical protein [Megasphaera]|jgi:hypothetical protein|uniref:Uncharacterized protein n=1 Tax=Megasphaera elsdenii TaxID=907 RepID=A0A2S0M628_MEGEL|nr:hypothetical protein [Megasphaera elsdenii]AVO26894.1 hypothetical protein C6Y28_04300 [Megasphaera elsdenii]
MSNHEIGHVMDIAIKGILDLYDEGAFSAATARKLIKTNLRLVAGYDGNTYEALETMAYTHCGNCLKKYAQGEKFIVEVEAHDCITPEDKLDRTWWDNVTNKTEYIGASLCMDCFQKIFKDALPEATKERIMKEASRTSEDNPGTSYLW